MAIHRPELRFLDRQVRSILDQEGCAPRLVAVIDGPDREAEAALERLNEPRILVQRSSAHLGIVGAFEQGLATAIEHSRSERDVFAFADQDDIWERGKLARLAAEIEREACPMAFSDALVIDDSDAVIARSLIASENRLSRPTLGNLLVSNSVSGMAMLFDKRIARLSLPFPRIGEGAVLHDWWLAVLARAVGRVIFLSEPLVRYRAHGSNVIGARLERARPTDASRVEHRKPLSRWLRHYRLRQEIAEAARSRIGQAGFPIPSALELVARGGAWGCAYFASQAALLFARRKLKMSSLALGAAVGSLAARFCNGAPCSSSGQQGDS